MLFLLCGIWVVAIFPSPQMVTIIDPHIKKDSNYHIYRVSVLIIPSPLVPSFFPLPLSFLLPLLGLCVCVCVCYLQCLLLTTFIYCVVHTR